MDTNWLQDFLTLAEVANFTRAAETRNLSQAAFSRRIQAIESWVGAKLIDRSTFPPQLTEAGERFCLFAVETLARFDVARADIGGAIPRNHVRITIPYTLATAKLTRWWQDWAADDAITSTVTIGSVLDNATALNAGEADLLICYEHKRIPMRLDNARFDRAVLGIETVRPYASHALVASGAANFPGTPDRPVPLLTYSSSAYFARVVTMLLDASARGVCGHTVMEVEMSDVMAEYAMAGIGVGWLADSTVERSAKGKLVAIGAGEWDANVSVVAFKAKLNNSPAMMKVWSRIWENRIRP